MAGMRGLAQGITEVIHRVALGEGPEDQDSNDNRIRRYPGCDDSRPGPSGGRYVGLITHESELYLKVFSFPSKRTDGLLDSFLQASLELFLPAEDGCD